MELVKPDIGLLFWMTICFVILLILMKKYAWGPILKALNDRENGIRDALNEAQKARDEISSLQENQNNIIIEAKAEREVIISGHTDIKGSVLVLCRPEWSVVVGCFVSFS